MKVTVPYNLINLAWENKAELLQRLEDFGADEIFLTILTCNFSKTEEQVRLLREHLPFFEQHGIRPALWVGGSLHHFPVEGEHQHLVDVTGKRRDEGICPLDEAFCEYLYGMVQAYAKTGIRKIALDDDLRMHFPNDRPMCFCDKHMKLYSDYLGRPVTREEFEENLTDKGDNEYRRAWWAVNQQTLLTFVNGLRRAVDEVDASIQLELCSGPAHWGADGTDPFALTRAMAGVDTPEMRLSGGPYWHSSPDMAVVDLVRHQALECKKQGILSLAEGDVWPRIRRVCSASLLELFHTALIADGYTDRILKYGLSYYSSVMYEGGYAAMAIRNKPLYREVARLFADKTAVGFSPFEPFDCFAHAQVLPRCPEANIMSTPTRQFTAGNSLPTTYDGGGVNVVFGENARCLERALLKNGSVLDIAAAMILTERGVDVGLATAPTVMRRDRAALAEMLQERYLPHDERMYLSPVADAVFYSVEPKATATVLSVLEDCHDGTRSDGVYRYENANGERFLVLPFAAGVNSREVLIGECRQRQMVDNYAWLAGEALAASCSGNPDLYMMTKRGEDGSLAIGLWNCSDDPILQPCIELGEEYATVTCVNCEAHLDGKRITLTSTVHSNESAFILLEK